MASPDHCPESQERDPPAPQPTPRSTLFRDVLKPGVEVPRLRSPPEERDIYFRFLRSYLRGLRDSEVWESQLRMVLTCLSLTLPLISSPTRETTNIDQYSRIPLDGCVSNFAEHDMPAMLIAWRDEVRGLLPASASPAPKRTRTPASSTNSSRAALRCPEGMICLDRKGRPRLPLMVYEHKIYDLVRTIRARIARLADDSVSASDSATCKRNGRRGCHRS